MCQRTYFTYFIFEVLAYKQISFAACDCDIRGSIDDGICDSVQDDDNGIVAGQCHCKLNVKGRRCDQCREGFWNFTTENPLGCQECTCNTLGTVDNKGCDVFTGGCTCKRLVTGRDCNQCMPQTYGLSDSHDGCTPCDCDIGGALDAECDVISGQCRCRPHMQGRNCSTPKQNYFIPTLHTVLEAESPFTICTTLQNSGVSKFFKWTLNILEFSVLYLY